MKTDEIIEMVFEYSENRSPEKLLDIEIAITERDNRIAELETKLERYEFDEKQNKEPKTLSKEIEASHPSITGKHDEIYVKALELVGERFDKYELVDLVNYLLVIEKEEKALANNRIKELEAQILKLNFNLAETEAYLGLSREDYMKLKEKHTELETELELRDRALRLAIEDVIRYYPYPTEDEVEHRQYYICKAQEELNALPL